MEENRPLLTVLVVGYAQEQFVAAAVRSVLAQTYTPLEIIVSDDCSPDGTFEVMKQVVSGYRGPHTVILNQTPTNLRLANHINLLAGMAKGELIAIAAGDDVSDPERMTNTWEAYRSSGGRALSIFGQAIVIDEQDREHGLYSAPRTPADLTAMALARSIGGILGCTHTVHRSMFEIFGPLDPETHSEDVVLPFRSALLGEVVYVDKVMALYRLHDTNRHFRDPKKLTDPDRFFYFLKKVIPGVVADFQTRLRDIEIAKRIQPNRVAEFDELRRVTEHRLAEVEAERDMLETGSAIERLKIIVRAVRRGTTLRRAARWILTFFFPRIYIRVQAFQQKKAGLRSPTQSAEATVTA